MRFKRFIEELLKSRMMFRLQMTGAIRSVNGGFDPIEGLAFSKGHRIQRDDVNRLHHAAEFLDLPFDVMTDIVRAVDYEDLENFPRAARYRRLLIKYLEL